METTQNILNSPWKQDEGTFGKDFKIVDASQRTVARIPWTRGDLGPVISAAPELLEACEEIIRGMIDGSNSTTKNVTTFAVKKVQAAIAKAKGA